MMFWEERGKVEEGSNEVVKGIPSIHTGPCA